MTEGIQTFADNRQTYKAKGYINSLKHVYKILYTTDSPTFSIFTIKKEKKSVLCKSESVYHNI
jgi:hypothetical protein